LIDGRGGEAQKVVTVCELRTPHLNAAARIHLPTENGSRYDRYTPFADDASRIRKTLALSPPAPPCNLIRAQGWGTAQPCETVAAYREA